MKKEEIHLYDIKRILLGQAPVEFMLEVLIRTVITYIALLFLLKLLGKRMDGQVTIIEMSVMITLGAIVSVAMQLPDRGCSTPSFTSVLMLPSSNTSTFRFFTLNQFSPR